jgi:hypothetical protein
MSNRLLSYVQELEGRDNLQRRLALLSILRSEGFLPTCEQFKIFGRKGTNIIVEFGDGEKEVLGTAHYDVVKGSPGANDNASGVSVLLDVCTRLKTHQPKNKIKIVFFDSEEAWLKFGSFRIGCLGSWSYIKRHRLANITGVYNLDMCGAGNMVLIWPVERGRENCLFLANLQEVLNRIGVHYRIENIPMLLATSDHIFFRRKGLNEAVSISMVPREIEDLIKTPIQRLKFIIKVIFSRHFHGNSDIPSIIRRIHSPEDKSEYLSEDVLRLMSEIVYQALINLDLKS